ncbi:hypothetical protein [Emticicia sp. W12TSBA100-4]|uniref:hypothetical protein n=1 Tax=Emticicia sp. W12TSBA100-4 TaxID=3160965 RepID=UPI003305EF67
MKTKSLLFAALVSISFATASCQKEENIMPNVGYYSSNKNPSTTISIDGKETDAEGNVILETQNHENVAKSNQPKSTIPTNIMQIDSDDVK